MGHKSNRMLQKTASLTKGSRRFDILHGRPQRSTFEKGESVRIRKTGELGIVVDTSSWGDYVLQGREGKYFSPSNLEKV